MHTGFIPQHFDTLFPPISVSDDVLAQAAIGLIINENNASLRNALKTANSSFSAIGTGFRVNHKEIRTVKLNHDGKEAKISLTESDDGMRVKVNDGAWRNVQVKTVKQEGRFSLKVNIDGSVFNFSVVISPETVTIFNQDGKTELQITQSKFLTSADSGDASKSSLSAPMPGIIDKIFVNVGDEVQPGQSIAVIIAMKMEYVLKAAVGGRVKSIAGKVGDNIGKGVTIVEIDAN